MHIATLLPDQDITSKLLENESVLIDIKNNDGMTASQMIDLVTTVNNTATPGQHEPYEPPEIEENIVRKQPGNEHNSNNLTPPIH